MNLKRPLCTLVLTIGFAVSAVSLHGAETTIAAPPIAVGFPSASSDAIRPADSTGAVNGTYVMTGSSAGIHVHTRDGSIVSELTLHEFWHSAAAIGKELTKPRIAYDTAAKRWVAVAVRGYDTLLVGVSASDDPNGAWFRYEFLFKGCDRPRLALTRDTIMIAMESPAAWMLSFSKAELYAGTASPTFRKVAVEYDSMPVHAPESAIEYIVTVAQSKLRLRRLDQYDEPHRAFSGGFGWQLPRRFDTAPVRGTANELRLGGGDVQSAILRDGWLYAVHRIGTSTLTGDDNALVWWKVDPAGVKPSEAGIIDSPGDVAYAFPSLAVNRKGGMLISFCTLSNRTYPGASYVYRDPEGRISVPAVLRAGESPVNGSSKWGEYTTVVEDPNGRDFWVGQIYATRETWGTWWANVTTAAPPRGRVVRH